MLTLEQLNEIESKTADLVEPTPKEVMELVQMAKRYAVLRDMQCNSMSVSKNDDHTANYMTAEEYINNYPKEFEDEDPFEVGRMKATNTIWRLQVYPDTPVGCYVIYGSTLDFVIDSVVSQTV